MHEYTLTMNSKQAKKAFKAIELLMRLKINQPEEITRSVMPEDYWTNKGVDKQKFDNYIERRDLANEKLKEGFKYIFPFYAEKDEEWYVLYNLYQVLRYNIHLAENPTSTGVDSHPPMRITDEPLPECNWKEIKE